MFYVPREVKECSLVQRARDLARLSHLLQSAPSVQIVESGAK